MSTGNGRKKLSLNTMSVSLGCSCSRPKLSLMFFHPKTRLKTTQKFNKRQQNQYSSPSSWTNDDDEASTTTTATTTTSTVSKSSSLLRPLSPSTPISHAPSRSVKSTQKPKKRKEKRDGGDGRGFGRVGGEGVAVEKDSDDPYLDFRHSMLQMILENQIYSKNDMRELLNCFLQLNAPSHHGVIVSAFTEIWNGVFSVRSAGFPPRRHDAVTNENPTYQYDYNGNGNDANVSRDYYYY